MSDLDDRIRTALREVGAAAPDQGRVASDVVRRRTRRGRARKLQVAALALVVVAGTVGTYAVLDRVFTPSPTTLDQPITHENGPLVSVEERFNGDSYLVLDPLDGTQARAITPSMGEQVWDPAASPDGNLVAYVAVAMGGVDDDFEPELRLVDIRTGQVVVVATGILFDPSWSPDGDWIAVERITVNQGGIAVIEVTTRESRYLTDEGGDPAWSPDGSTIAYEVPTDRPPQRSEPEGIFDVLVAGGDPQLVSVFGSSPAWSPDGSTIAFADQGAGIWTMTKDGADLRLVAGQAQASPGGSEPSFTAPGWSPDGSRLTYVEEGTDPWIVSDALDGTKPERLTKGVDYTWLPRANPPIDPEAEATPPPPGSEGQDIGLERNVCEATRLGDLNLVADGFSDTAWTGYFVGDDGRCTRAEYPKVSTWIAAVDLDGDGAADAFTGLPDLCEYQPCSPYDATDLDADGDDELVVIATFSILDHLYLSAERTDDGDAIRVLEVASPGHPPALLPPGEPLITNAAGDAGYSAWIRCESYPEDPILVHTWASALVDSDEPTEWHETKLELLEDGMFHVVATNDLQLPPDQDPGWIRSSDPACGVDFNLWAAPNP